MSLYLLEAFAGSLEVAGLDRQQKRWAKDNIEDLRDILREED